MNVDFTLLIPEFILTAGAFLVLLVDLVLPASQEARRNLITAATAAAGLVVVVVVALATQWETRAVLYDELLIVDRYSLLFKTLFAGTGLAAVLLSIDYVGRKMRHPGEYYALIMFAVLGGTLMAQAGELLTAFISIELLSFSLYVLVGLSRGDRRTAEASTKYILLGAISTALMLYGISQLYGALGTTTFSTLGDQLAFGWNATIIIGFVMFLAGLGFKLSMVPFHLWAPDVYEGAPTPITALIASSGYSHIARSLRWGSCS
jgi:NADH-quinone oxidoreductase subunit N